MDNRRKLLRKDGCVTECSKQTINAMKTNNKPLKIEQFCRIYVKGLNILSSRNRNGMNTVEIKKELFSNRFKLSKILNISHVGSDFTEFLIHSDYSQNFKSKCNELELDYSESYDPSLPHRLNATEELKTMVLGNFSDRLNRIIERTRKIEVRTYFENWLKLVTGRSMIDKI